MDQRKEEAQEALHRLLNDYRTVTLATCNSQGRPQASYTPVAFDREHNFYIFVSELSEHTQNLRENPMASLMIIEDEKLSEQLFARNRLTIGGQVEALPREGERWLGAAEVYRARFGKFFDQLAQLRDFHMFCFKPEEARIVVGFGAAFQIQLPQWSQLELITGK